VSLLAPASKADRADKATPDRQCVRYGPACQDSDPPWSARRRDGVGRQYLARPI